MPILTYPSGPLDVNCYLCFNDKDAIIIDPAVETDVILGKLKELGLNLKAVFLTHLHFDHVYGAAPLQEATKLPIYAGSDDIAFSDKLFTSAYQYGLPPVTPFEMTGIEEGEHDFGSIHVSIFHVPGHSPGSLAYYIADEKAVFTGDVLFYRSIGRTDFPLGNFEILEKSIRTKLYTLPTDTVAYCGHGLETNIGDEISKNPFVAGLS